MVLSRSRAAVAACTTLLFGISAAQASARSWDPASFSYGSQRVDTKASQTFAFTNAGDPIHVSGIALSGAVHPGVSDGFHIGDDTSAPCLNQTLATGATCSVAIDFTPDAVGFYSIGLSLLDDGNARIGPSVPLSGSGVPWLELTPASFDFGTQAVSTVGVPHAFTVTAHGAQIPGPAQVVGTERDDFLITQNDCSGVFLADHATCEVHLRFAPSALGARNAVLQFVTGQFSAEAVGNT